MEDTESLEMSSGKMWLLTYGNFIKNSRKMIFSKKLAHAANFYHDLQRIVSNDTYKFHVRLSVL